MTAATKVAGVARVNVELLADRLDMLPARWSPPAPPWSTRMGAHELRRARRRLAGPRPRGIAPRRPYNAPTTRHR